jgi:FkbM family methyltransferase
MGLQSRARHWYRLIRDAAYRHRIEEDKWLRGLPRRTPAQATLLGRKVQIADALSFLVLREEIFAKEVYRFCSEKTEPVIVDGGAYIGLSTIYLQMLFPRGRVIAFEPDSALCDMLVHNLEVFGLKDVDVQRSALWRTNGTVEFMPDMADGGRVVELDGSRAVQVVPCIRLRDLLGSPVDMLKLDIEGAETAVLADCADRLGEVRNLFVEYHSFVDVPQTLDNLLSILGQAGYRVHLHPVVGSARPFVSLDLNGRMDMQVNIFAYRPEKR